MIVLEQYMPEEVVPRNELLEWRARIRKTQPKINCPKEVMEFIEAMALKMADFGQMRVYNEMIKGRDLLLAGMKEIKGEKVYAWASYPLQVPHMIAVDHYTWMHRIFRRKGKQGLIDYCRAKVKHTELERVLEILNVEVFHIHSIAFTETMNRINQARKLEIELEQ